MPHGTDTADHKALDGRAHAREIKDEVTAEVVRLKESGWSPKLVSIAIGDAEPVMLYIRNQKRNAEACGIDFEERFYPAEISREEVLAAIQALNADPRVSGVIIQRPVPEHDALGLSGGAGGIDYIGDLVQPASSF